MTFAEKARKDYPEKIDILLGRPRGCPHNFGYERVQTASECNGRTCSECWAREIPEKSPKALPTSQKLSNYLWDLYVAFEKTGFDKAQAFDLTKIAYEVIMEHACKDIAYEVITNG